MTKLHLIQFIILIGLLTSACFKQKSYNEIETKVIKHKHFTNLSSASGIVYQDDNIYLVGDDIPFMAKLNADWDIEKKQQLSKLDIGVNARMPKSSKPDFESMAYVDDSGNKYLMVMSSGSKKHSRDTALLVPFGENEQIIRKNMRPLFDEMKKQAALADHNSMNIEGLAFSSSKAYLFHRGNVSENLIFELDKDQLISFMKQDGAPIPKSSVFPFALPNEDGLAAGFSGACYVEDYEGILFTASLENTTNEIDDGAIMGSYLGFIPLGGLSSGTFISGLITQNKLALKKKLEGITVKNVHDDKIMVLLACDNDDGSSDLFEIEVKLNE